MKCLKRNKRLFYYQLYLGKEKTRDENGFYTGEEVPVYSSVTTCLGNISPSKGTTEAELFGSSVQYDRVIVIDDADCPIDEHTVLFIDKKPEGAVPKYDYIVKKVARSLNSVSYAISKVDVS